MTRRSLLAATMSAMARPALALHQPSSSHGRRAGDTRKVDAIELCWCPSGRFVMGSPRSEPERRSWCRDWYHARLPGGTDPDLYAARDHIGFRVVIVQP
jgi:hypothetical protein